MITSFEKALARHQAQIKRSGQLLSRRSSYIQRNMALFGVRKLIPASRTLAARFAKPEEGQPHSAVVTVGEAPDGFGKQVLWDAHDASLAVVVFLNAGDPLGVMVSGVKATDTIQFVSATGIASYAEETKNKGVGSFIGVIAAGANVAASAFGAPELAPVIGAAAKFAQEQFEEKRVKTKRRDPFGVDPGTGDKARQEGGVIISLPAAGQIYYSGDGDHEERWIKKPGTRDDAHHPDHVKNAFFLQKGRGNSRTAGVDGDIIIAPWDWKFEDNLGFYRLNILFKRGNGQPPVVDFRHRSTQTTGRRFSRVGDHRAH